MEARELTVGRILASARPCTLDEMVLLEHIGFGGRDRPLWLYYWDLRDGEEFAGWWCEYHMCHYTCHMSP